MTFAEKLKSLRKQASMSQEQLAEKLGVSRQAVTKWETDTGIPDLENIKSISSLFDISIDELLSNEKASQKNSEPVSYTHLDVYKRQIVHRAGNHKSICRFECKRQFIDNIIKNTFTQFTASSAGNASSDIHMTDTDTFCFYPFCFKYLSHFFKRYGSVSIFSWASINH